MLGTVRLAPVFAEIVLSQVVVTLAGTWDAGAIGAAAAIPPFLCSTICYRIPACLHGVWLADFCAIPAGFVVIIHTL